MQYEVPSLKMGKCQWFHRIFVYIVLCRVLYSPTVQGAKCSQEVTTAEMYEAAPPVENHLKVCNKLL